MRLKNIAIAMVLAFVPVLASAQFKDLDVAMSNLSRGFGSGDPQAIVSGMAGDDQVQLQFPGLIEQSGFYGRDQATYILDGLFNKVKPSGFDTKSARKVSAEGQYHLVASDAAPQPRHLVRQMDFCARRERARHGVDAVERHQLDKRRENNKKRRDPDDRGARRSRAAGVHLPAERIEATDQRPSPFCRSVM